MLVGCIDDDEQSLTSNPEQERIKLEEIIASGDLEAIESADTSGVTDMSSLFEGSELNPDLSGWDTSNVTTMSRMFEGASKFDQPVASWNTSNVTDMSAMFKDAQDFNQPIVFDTGNVLDMSSMFENSDNFQQDLSNLNMSSVIKDNNIIAGSGITNKNYFPSAKTSSGYVQLELMKAVFR